MIRIRGLTQTYAGQPVLHGLELDLAQGEFVYLQGPSGSGKSTLLRILNRQIEQYDGEIAIGGQELRSIPRYAVRRLVATIHQSYELIERKTALENVTLAGEVLGRDPKSTRKAAADFLDKVGLGGKEALFPRQLSGGEQQRVAIARALLNGPSVLLADEPTGNLDHANAVRIVRLLRELNESEGTAILMVTHSDELIREFPSRTVYMNGGVLHAHALDAG
ncbi:cell division ATP-binding protein FtsE [Paenibacillus puerhi]|uniref:cell division ATP-binding protein FtsE n=1 Tax=Paenibacillus puerhi TaxID=2692622 RepID=UPI00135790C3|nr:ABC transporter ATP-binding protein [Paenibacillus puerhi]